MTKSQKKTVASIKRKKALRQTRLLPAVADDKRMQKVIRRVRWLKHFYHKEAISFGQQDKWQAAHDFQQMSWAYACLESELNDIDRMYW